MFETHLANVAHTWERVSFHEEVREAPITKAKKVLSEAERAKACNVHSAWASIVNNTREAEFESARVNPEESKRKQRYGVGCDLLKKMGWNVSEESHRRMVWEKVSEEAAAAQGTKQERNAKTRTFNRPGLGYAKCNVAVQQDDTEAAEKTAEPFDLQYLGTVSSSTKFHAHNTHSTTTQAQTHHKHTSTMTPDSDSNNPTSSIKNSAAAITFIHLGANLKGVWAVLHSGRLDHNTVRDGGRK